MGGGAEPTCFWQKRLECRLYMALLHIRQLQANFNLDYYVHVLRSIIYSYDYCKFKTVWYTTKNIEAPATKVLRVLT
jgi:hypothetical protein